MRRVRAAGGSAPDAPDSRGVEHRDVSQHCNDYFRSIVLAFFSSRISSRYSIM